MIATRLKNGFGTCSNDDSHPEHLLPALLPNGRQVTLVEEPLQGHTMQIVTVDLNAKWQEIRQTLLGMLTPIPSNAEEAVTELV
jgi:hypothetical protein